MRDPSLIRNFCIIAHIDHGKSTLADRFIEKARVIDARRCRIRCSTTWTSSASAGSRSRARPSRLEYAAKDGKTYTLNLVDTPGHVDFSYEVSRAIASCEGALLLIDATQGVEAQTLANMYMASSTTWRLSPSSTRSTCPRPTRTSPRQIERDLASIPNGALLVSGRFGHRGRRAPRGDRRSASRRPQASAADPCGPSYSTPITTLTAASSCTCRVFDGAIVPGEKIRLCTTAPSTSSRRTGSFA